jgi:hypothetical protein
MLILLPGLPIVALVLALTHHTHSATIVVAWWTIFCAVLAARALQVRARDKKRRLAEMQTRLREGIRKRAWYDFEVPRAAWDPAWNTSRNKWTDWVEGELRTLLPTDTVLAWAWRTGPRCGAGGYAIERFGRIIAEARTWDPEAPLC